MKGEDEKNSSSITGIFFIHSHGNSYALRNEAQGENQSTSYKLLDVLHDSIQIIATSLFSKKITQQISIYTRYFSSLIMSLTTNFILFIPSISRQPVSSCKKDFTKRIDELVTQIHVYMHMLHTQLAS